MFKKTGKTTTLGVTTPKSEKDDKETSKKVNIPKPQENNIK